MPTGRFPLLLRSALALSLAFLATLTGAVVAQPASASITSPFAKRFSANATGDILLRGNTLLTCPAGAANCLNARAGTGTTLNNNNFTMGFVDVDGSVGVGAATRSSSSADVALPSGSTVLFAGLYWSGATTAGTGGAAPPTGTAPGRLLLRAPGDTAYRTVAASTTYTNTQAGAPIYQSYADLTGLVNTAGSGAYVAADIHAATGVDRYAAWTLVVVVSAPSLPTRNLTVFDGFGAIFNSTGNTVATIPVSGFTTPPSGAVRTRLGAVVYEGDRGSIGDSFSLVRSNGTSVTLSDARNPANNVFNSTVTDAGVTVPGRDPVYDNTLGYDADVFDDQGSATPLLRNGDTSATLRLATGGETFYPGVVTFATDLYAPKLVGSKTQTVTDVDGDGFTGPGDLINYTIDVRNDGLDVAQQSLLTDAIPLGTTYLPGSLRVDGAAVSDPADADRGEYDGATRALAVRLGVSPGTTGGDLAVAATTRVTFSVRVADTNGDGARIINAANLSYVGAQSGAALSSSSNAVAEPYTAPRSDLRVEQSVTPGVVQRDGARAVTWTITVTNDGPKGDSSVTLTDVLPADLTAVSFTGATCSGTTGTVTCALGALAVGESRTITVSGTVSATAGATVTNAVSVAGASVDPNLTNNSAATAVVVNSPPTARADTAAVVPGASVTVAVLANDSDPDGDPLTLTTVVVQPPAHGTASVGADGRLTYTPTDPSFKGTETLSYQVCDDNGGCATGTLTVSVANAAPVAADDRASTATGTAVLIDVLANDTDANGDPLSIDGVIAAPPASQGTVSVQGGRIRFQPAAGFAGSSTFTYRVCDNDVPAACATATVAVLVDNATPDAVDDAVVAAFQTPRTIPVGDLLANDTDPNPADVLTVTSVQNPVGGTVVLAGGTVTFTPANGFVGTGSFTYTISDGGRTDTATVTVEVPNTAPVARDDVATVAPVGSTDVAVLANDADAQSPRADLTVALIAAPAHGSALVVNGEVRYTPTAGYKGADSLQYQVCDPSGLCDTATLTITVANAAPVAVDDSRTTTLNQPVVVSVLTNDSDPNPGDVLRLTRIVTRPANGVATFDAAAGTITYTPATGFVGDDALVYEVCDNDTPPACSTATFLVATANQPPVASDDVAVSQHRAGQPTVVSINVMANDSDPDGEPLALVGLTQPSVGTASIVDGRVVYTAPDGFVGTESFTYEVSDGSGGTARAVVSVTVLNRAPDVVADSASTTTNSPVAIAVLANDSDPDRDGLTVAILTQPASGTVTAQADGTLLYTPATGASGQFSFTYRACDPHAGCADAVVSVQVVDGAPNARDDVATVLPGGTVDITVLANDTEPDGQPLSDPVIVTGPTTGTATVIAGGAIRYVADSPAPAGTVVTFTYRTCDNSATPLCDEAVVRVTIYDAAPVTAADGATTTRSTPVTLNVVGNDTDANGDALRVGSVSQPSSGGTVRLMPDGTVRFTPDGSVVGPVVFTYTACDPGGQCTTGTVTVTVTNAAPVAVNDLDSVQPGGSVTIPALANDRDPDAGDVVSFVSNTTPTVGTVTWQPATGTFLVQAPTGYVGPITFDYTITDGRLTDTATVTVQVTDVPPLAEDDAATTSRNRTVDIDVRGNDGEPNGQALSLPEVQLTPAHGTVVVLADGTLRYTPDGTFVGEVTFTYQVCDTGAPRQCDTATVFMAVTNARPVARDDFAAVNPGERVDVVVLRNDGDPDPGDVVTVARIVAAPAQGTAVLQSDGRITYTAPTGFAGSVTFTYEVTDGLTMSTASVTVVVGDVAPVAVDDAVTTAEDTDLLVSPLINDTEPNGQALRITAVTQPVAGGTVEVVPGGQVRFRPTPGTSGVVTFGYTACDPSDLCSTATVTVTVGAVNDPPVFTADATNTTQSLAFGGTPLAMRATDVDSSSLTYRILSGSLPPGVGLLPDGTFTGSATQAGSTTARVEVCDSAGGCTVSTLVIAISAQVVPVLPATPAPPEAGTTVTSVVAPIAATPATAAPTVLPTTIAVPPSQSPTTIATPTTAAPVEPSVEPAPSVRRTPQAVSPARLGRLPRTGVDASALLFTAITGALLLLVGAISVAVTSRRR